jgi:uncharacterized glyoxalase superfamily protein PhnB
VTTNGAPNIFPDLAYTDAKAAVEFLTKAFGFTAHEVMCGPDGEVYHAELRFGAGTVMLEPASDASEYGMFSPQRLGGVSAAICVHVEDPDAHYARAKAEGADILIELMDTNYGARTYSARDLEGHVWTFSTYQPSNG